MSTSDQWLQSKNRMPIGQAKNLASFENQILIIIIDNLGYESYDKAISRHMYSTHQKLHKAMSDCKGTTSDSVQLTYAGLSYDCTCIENHTMPRRLQ